MDILDPILQFSFNDFTQLLSPRLSSETITPFVGLIHPAGERKREKTTPLSIVKRFDFHSDFPSAN